MKILRPKTNMKLLITVLFVFTYPVTFAQTINPSIDTIRWEYNQVENLLNGDRLEMKGSITSYGDKRYVWEQDGYTTTYEIVTSSNKSSWTTATTDGNLESAATCKGLSGVVTIKRSKDKITIELNFEQTGKLSPHLVLTVNSFSKI